MCAGAVWEKLSALLVVFPSCCVFPVVNCGKEVAKTMAPFSKKLSKWGKQDVQTGAGNGADLLGQSDSGTVEAGSASDSDLQGGVDDGMSPALSALEIGRDNKPERMTNHLGGSVTGQRGRLDYGARGSSHVAAHLSGVMVRFPVLDDAVAQERYLELARKVRAACPKPAVIVTASAESGEGKTTTAMNLALALSMRDDGKVLLVDGNLRNPSINRLLDIGERAGLAQILDGSTPFQQLVVEISHNIHFLPAGMGMAVDAAHVRLNSSALGTLFESFKSVYDHVVVDVPSVLLCSDAGLVAERADGVVLVVRAGKTTVSSVQNALELLRPGNVLGCVLNGVTGREDEYVDRGAKKSGNRT